MMMLMTHSHRPPAACDLLFMVSGLKSAPRESFSFLASSTLVTGTLPRSICSLKFFRFCRNLVGSFIIFTEPFQLLSLTLPLLSTSMTGSMPACSISADSHTVSTPPGGREKAFNSLNSFLSKTSKAASASATSGSASAKSLVHSSFLIATCSAICLHFTASMLAFSASEFTLAFSRPTSSAKASAFSALSCTTIAFSFNSSSSRATESCVSRSLTRPAQSLLSLSWRLSTFRCKMSV
mmetsp:Transcript_1498/g.3830  ORF Transcript_1498/g.3830 Transcript_1498/m.3830 type:complete len:238 (-) Transcript_1498:107-820(-)